MSYRESIEEAIKNGDTFYWDTAELSRGRSGGSVCPKCRKWGQTARKRKHDQPTFLYDCESCEIQDPFKRLWHKHNKNSSDNERDLHNNWLQKVRYYLEEMNYENELQESKKKLKELIHKIPFFEGV